MNGIDPPDPLAPEALALLDIDGSQRRSFRQRYETSDESIKKITLRALKQAVTHRTPASDETLDRVERRYDLRELYGD